MSLEIEIEGMRELQRAFAAASIEAQGRVGMAVLKTAVSLRTDVIRRVQNGPASGRTYELTNPRRTHTASAQGEAPATDQGRLVQSITFNKTGAMSATVGSAAVYAAALDRYPLTVSGAVWIDTVFESMSLAWSDVGTTRRFISQYRITLDASA